MDWAAWALLSAALFGANNLLVKFLIEQKVQNARTFYLIQGLLFLPIASVILLSRPFGPEISITAIGFGAGAGIAHSIGLMLMWAVLRNEEASRVVPVAHTFPIFVAILASVFLGESLGLVTWLGITITVAGSVLISARRVPGRRPFLGRSFLILALASFAFATSHTMSKQALADLSQWHVFGLFYLCMTIGFLSVGLRPSFLHEVSTIVRRPSSTVWFVIHQSIGALALGSQLAAFAAGPVSLAATIVATRPFFLFVFAVFTSWVVPRYIHEPLTRRILLVKFVAMAMIVTGAGSIFVVSPTLG